MMLIAGLPFSFRRLALKAMALYSVGTAASTGLIGLDRCWITGARIIGIAGSVLRSFGDGWSKMLFLVAAFLRLPYLPLLLLCSGLLWGFQSCRYTRCVDSLDFTFDSPYCRFRGKIAPLIVGSLTDDHAQLTCRNGIRFLLLVGLNTVLVIDVIAAMRLVYWSFSGWWSHSMDS